MRARVKVDGIPGILTDERIESLYGEPMVVIGDTAYSAMSFRGTVELVAPTHESRDLLSKWNLIKTGFGVL